MNTTDTQARFSLTQTSTGVYTVRDAKTGASISNVTTEHAQRWIAAKASR